MKIVVAGGTGFLGTALVRALSSDHDVVILSRRRSAPPAARVTVMQWTPDGSPGLWTAALEEAGAVVNLAGESIAARRWTAGQKMRILDSRLLATRNLAMAIAKASHPPAVFISGSAVGYYGPLGDDIVTEDHPPGADFLATVCVKWEGQALAASSSRTRVVLVRTGIVLDRREGALPKMLPPFWMGAGGPVGSGLQYWPWIHLEDWVALVRFALENASVSGPLNMTAPNPVKNRDFASVLGRVLHRPAFLTTPGFALKMLLGEMADGLLLSGQRAIPAKVEQLGFPFRYRDLEPALRAIFSQ
jgi:uncharacterized protein (TIGR01777 family)